jgi:8-oxo-dGTP diphosphatase
MSETAVYAAGAVVWRLIEGKLMVLVIHRTAYADVTLPKGKVDPGETLAETAVREVFEETGVHGVVDRKLGDVRYVYTWDGERIFKVVSFFLLRASGGRIGELPPGMEIEVAEARWVPLDDAAGILSYGGEQEMARKARDVLEGEASLAPSGASR